jgi:hypothetical protein
METLPQIDTPTEHTEEHPKKKTKGRKNGNTTIRPLPKTKVSGYISRKHDKKKPQRVGSADSCIADKNTTTSDATISADAAITAATTTTATTATLSSIIQTPLRKKKKRAGLSGVNAEDVEIVNVSQADSTGIHVDRVGGHRAEMPQMVKAWRPYETCRNLDLMSELLEGIALKIEPHDRTGPTAVATANSSSSNRSYLSLQQRMEIADEIRKLAIASKRFADTFHEHMASAVVKAIASVDNAELMGNGPFIEPPPDAFSAVKFRDARV